MKSNKRYKKLSSQKQKALAAGSGEGGQTASTSLLVQIRNMIVNALIN